MAWLIRCTYRPGGAAERLGVRASHIRYMLEWLPQTVFGAAMLDETERTPKGMVVALNVTAREQAQHFIDHEPYFCAGLFEMVELTPLIQMTPPQTPDFLLRELQKSQ
ncbi:YciI family protein [Ottowia thiooxydans]|uniref:Uncharacterized protein YciI n=1 Tax=Ottowia thiooxydans TaxID=219182 RepID=A0ABV2QGX5_9BURK